MTNVNVPTIMKKGIWFEKNRNRFRVRIYHRSKPFHLSYHPTYEEACAALLVVKELKKVHKPGHDGIDTTCTSSLLNTLKDSLCPAKLNQIQQDATLMNPALS